tara:strand:- start:116 stop:457 length:342 start_codon:yes stop_codon:yes gene_type:complete
LLSQLTPQKVTHWQQRQSQTEDDPKDTADHIQYPTKTCRDFCGIVDVKAWIDRAKANAQARDPRGHQEDCAHRNDRMPNIRLDEHIGRDHDQLRHEKKWQKHTPALCQQKTAH